MERIHVEHATPTFDGPIIGIIALIGIALIRISVFGRVAPCSHPGPKRERKGFGSRAANLNK